MDKYYKQICDRSEYNGECLEWKGALNDAGYGVKKIDGKFWYVHRWSYKVNHGDIPKGMTVDHMCHNSKCHNPEHLRLLTHIENCREGAIHALKKRGYSFPTLICDNCGIKFRTSESRLRHSKEKGFKTSSCSKKCASELLSKTLSGKGYKDYPAKGKIFSGKTFIITKDGISKTIKGIDDTLEFIGGKYDGLYKCVKGYRKTYLGYTINIE